MIGKLFLLPNLLHETNQPRDVFPEGVFKALRLIDGLIAENFPDGQKYLKKFELKKRPHDMPIAVFNKRSKKKDIDFILEPILKGEVWGLISDSGLPCIADPGAELVTAAHHRGIPVEAFVGPSSILLALELSGFSGQCFTFNGYLSKDSEELKRQIKSLEKESAKGTTQIFMERPYHCQEMLKILLEVLSPETRLCVATDLLSPQQSVISLKVARWKQKPLPDIQKRLNLFLFSVL